MAGRQRMHILYLSQYFPPEIGAGAARAYELAKHWVAGGHRVTALTGFPSYPTGGVKDGARGMRGGLTRRERMEGIDVVRTWALGAGARRTPDRAFAYSSFWLSSALRGLAIPRPEVVVASSPPLTVGLAGAWLSRAKGAPLVFDVRDLWPESLTDLGATAPGSVADRTLGAMARMLYGKAERVVVTAEATRKALLESGRAAAAKTVTIPNGVETEVFAPGDDDDGENIREALGLGGKFVVSFIGNIGLAQDLEVIVRAAVRLSGQAEGVHFLFVGEGPGKQGVINAVAGHNLPNFTFLPAQPRRRIPGFVRASDACLVALRKAPVNELIIPVRLLEFMSCARPVLLAAKGQPAGILRAAQGGLVTGPGDDPALAAAIVRLLRDGDLRRRMGRRGREYIVANFPRQRTAWDYLKVLEEVSGKAAG